MKFTKLYLLIFLITVTVQGCISQAEYEELKIENKKLKAELDDCKFGAEKLFNKAQAYFDSKDFENSKEQLGMLIQKYPESTETSKGKFLLIKVVNELKRIKQEEDLRKKRESEEKPRRLIQATKNMRKNYDEFKKITWFKDFSSPTNLSANRIFLYFGKHDDKNSPHNLRLKIQYYAESWLFIKDYQFNIDGKTFPYHPSNIETDSGYGGKIWEWSDEPISRYSYEIPESVALNVLTASNG